ncbi:hypothetical protein FRC03_011284 [Tulasnella sp. 419]|nr:hypothetical protein FRC02_010992 [Tulasnella sp. 418]KAG8955226.1 hypothetical protein FRC03_011284 [Tulasnella sp. 419]
MEPASLAIGIIPLVFQCARVAFSIQRICENVGGDFQKKRDKLCVDIRDLRQKMVAIKDARPSDTALKDDVEKLKSNLESFERDLQPLISKTWIGRIIRHDKIEKGLDDALDLVAQCERSFQTSCMRDLVVSNEITLQEVRNIASFSLTTRDNTTSILSALSEIRQQWTELVRSKQPPSESVISVKVRSLGARNARELRFDVGPTDTIRSIKKRMNDENFDITNIHFFSWSQGRHQLTETGQSWRYRKPNIPLSMIRSECGKLENQDVDWRLEYARNAKPFAVLLVHGIDQETGILIPHPITSVIDPLKREYSSHQDLTIAECRKLEDGAMLDWTDHDLLREVPAHCCSLCIKLAVSQSCVSV